MLQGRGGLQRGLRRAGRLGVVNADGGVRLYVEETGAGEPIIFLHELHADHREWEAQVRWFARYYRCITFNARGYPPSDVPADTGLYGFPFVVHDIATVLRGLGIPKAHVVGSSMGAYAALHFGWMYPEMVRSLVASGVGSGSPAADRAAFVADAEASARAYLEQGSPAVAETVAWGTRPHPASAEEPEGIRGILVPSARAFGGRQGADAVRVSGPASCAPGLCKRILEAAGPSLANGRRSG